MTVTYGNGVGSQFLMADTVPAKTPLADAGWSLEHMSALDCEVCNSLLAMSTVFSWFGLLYAGIPLAILLITARCLVTSSCRMFWLVVSGGISAVAALCALYDFAENRPELDDLGHGRVELVL